MHLRHPFALFTIILVTPLSGCTFKFELTSQRTALENQIMGSYRELDEDLVLASVVRSSQQPGVDAGVEAAKKRTLRARLNQDFNRDDIDELKSQGLLGEGRHGYLKILPAGIGGVDRAPQDLMELARKLVAEENADRQTIWAGLVATNDNLSEKDLPKVRETYANMQRESASTGHWLEGEDGRWTQKGSK